MGPSRRVDGALTTWVCVSCGNELYAQDADGGDLKCPRCGGHVFRLFDTPAPTDEVAQDYLESTGRHLELGDATPDTRTGDLRDLENL